jgi:hypothetical protein
LAVKRSKNKATPPWAKCSSACRVWPLAVRPGVVVRSACVAWVAAIPRSWWTVSVCRPVFPSTPSRPSRSSGLKFCAPPPQKRVHAPLRAPSTLFCVRVRKPIRMTWRSPGLRSTVKAPPKSIGCTTSRPSHSRARSPCRPWTRSGLRWTIPSPMSNPVTISVSGMSSPWGDVRPSMPMPACSGAVSRAKAWRWHHFWSTPSTRRWGQSARANSPVARRCCRMQPTPETAALIRWVAWTASGLSACRPMTAWSCVLVWDSPTTITASIKPGRPRLCCSIPSRPRILRTAPTASTASGPVPWPMGTRSWVVLSWKVYAEWRRPMRLFQKTAAICKPALSAGPLMRKMNSRSIPTGQRMGGCVTNRSWPRAPTSRVSSPTTVRSGRLCCTPCGSPMPTSATRCAWVWRAATKRPRCTTWWRVTCRLASPTAPHVLTAWATLICAPNWPPASMWLLNGILPAGVSWAPMSFAATSATWSVTPPPSIRARANGFPHLWTWAMPSPKGWSWRPSSAWIRLGRRLCR